MISQLQNPLGITECSTLTDYSIPHRYVARTLVVSASLKPVCILDADAVLATHTRSFDRGQQIEDPAHIEALERHKRRYTNLRVLITTNKPFSEWADVFSSAACVVTERARASERNPRRPPHPSF